MISRLVLLKPESSSVRMIADSRSVFTRSSSSYYYLRSLQHGCAKVGGKKEKEKERMEILRGERGEEGRKRNGGDYTRSFAARRDYSHVTASTLEIHIRLWNECLTPSGMATYNSLRTKYSHG